MLTEPNIEQRAQSASLHSSDSLKWYEISVDQISRGSGELQLESLQSHRVCMLLATSPRLEQTRNGRTFIHTFERGQAQLLPSGTSGIWRSRHGMEALNLQLSPTFIRNVAAQTTHGDPAKIGFTDQFLIHDAQVEHIGLALLAEVIDGAQNGALYRNTLATALTVHLLRKYSSAHIDDRLPPALSRIALQRALEYIDSHFSEDIALDALAGLANVSVSHFNKLFRQDVGVSPYQYILQKRVERAKRLLLQGELTIAQIAAEVGFYDQSHLTRHMRNLLGVTPGTFQRH